MIQDVLGFRDAQLIGTFLIAFLILFGVKLLTVIYRAAPAHR